MTIKRTYPHISCLLLTRDEARFFLVQKSIASFLAQKYPNKELVVLCDGEASYREQLYAYCQSLKTSMVRPLMLAPLNSLGDARNAAVHYAEGEIVCQWNDDDLSSSKRLLIQEEALYQQKAEAVFLKDHLHYFSDVHKLYWIRWKHCPAPGSLMAYTEVLKASGGYPALSLGEDKELYNVLKERGGVFELEGVGYHFLYTYTGLNSWDREHHEGMLKYHHRAFHPFSGVSLWKVLPEYQLDAELFDCIRIACGSLVSLKSFRRT